MSDQLLGVLVGGGIAVVSAISVALMTERRARGEWRRQARLTAARNVLRAFQQFSREITNLAVSERDRIDGSGSEWRDFHEAAVAWNSARHEAALIVPSAELALLAELDQELDRVMDAAITRQWDSTAFRRERTRLGEIASAYVREARRSAGETAADLPSVWSWSTDESDASRTVEAGAGKPLSP